jgi:2,4-dienoyl-CoA reductase-like NADH-dependent reductase (Old Yellow Enzyme family)
MARKNLMTDRLIDFHRAFAAGGVGMTTLAYCAVSPEGQGAPNEIVVRPEAVAGLRRFTDAMHDLGTAASMQLGHAGPVGAHGLAASKVLAKQRMKQTRPASESDLATVVQDFRRAASLAVDSGFDAIELHFGHGYLISNFLSPRLNKRTDQWGGSLENRARLARLVANEVKEEVGDRVAVFAKLNLADGVPGGFWVDEAVQVATMLEADGALDALELTGGSSFENPMYLFRGEAPVHEMAAMFPPAMRLGFKLTASRFMPEYPFEEAYFLPYARQVRAAVSMPLVLLGGITKRETVASAIDEGFAFVAMGRTLLREPDLLNRWRDGATATSLCVHCNKCMPSIYRGTHCVLVPPEHRPGHTHA